MTELFTSIPPAAADEPQFIDVVNTRAHVRVKVELAIAFGSEHNFFAGFVDNLSAGGIFIATYHLLPIGETLAFEVQVPGCAEPVRGLGEVRWVREPRDDGDMVPGMGIRFSSLDDGARAAIDAYIARREPMFYDDE